MLNTKDSDKWGACRCYAEIYHKYLLDEVGDSCVDLKQTLTARYKDLFRDQRYNSCDLLQGSISRENEKDSFCSERILETRNSPDLVDRNRKAITKNLIIPSCNAILKILNVLLLVRVCLPKFILEKLMFSVRQMGRDRITLKSGFPVDSLDKEIRKNEMKWTIKTRDNISSRYYCTVLSVLRIFRQGLYQTCDVLNQPRAGYPANRTSYHVTGHYVRHTHERGIDCKKPAYTR